MIETLIFFVLLGFIFWFLFRGPCESRKQNTSEKYGLGSPSTSPQKPTYSTCQFLQNQGYSENYYQDIIDMCKRYTDACGDASNTGFVFNNIKNMNPNDTLDDRIQAMELMYSNAMYSIPPNPGGYCETAVSCFNPGDACAIDGYGGFKCQNYNASPGQPSPACF